VNNLQSTLVELKINIERAASADRPVVREIYLRKSVELIEALLRKPEAQEKASGQQLESPTLFQVGARVRIAGGEQCGTKSV
jgi:hypothetical protein